MKKTFVAWAVTTALLLSSSGNAKNREVSGAPVARTVFVYTGEVNAKSADRFLTTIANNVDRVIGVRVFVQPSRDEEFAQTGYLASYSDNQLGVSKSDPKGMDGGIEVVKNGLVQRTMGGYSIDGMFIVKPGGLNQGIASFGLQPVDEATVRLNPAVRVVERPF